MKLYCMCHAINDKPDSQHYMAPNRYAAVPEEWRKDDFPPVALRKPMTIMKISVRQVLLVPEDDHENNWDSNSRPRILREHFPNVDMFECPVCRSRIVRE
mgnify:FL=1